MKKNKIIVAGHICLDITPTFSAYRHVQLDELLQPGKLLHVNEAIVHTGGVVSNTGLALNFFGADVKLLGKIGADSFGKLVLDQLGEHVDTSTMIVSDGVTTSYSIVLAVPEHDRMFLHNSGANDTFASEDISNEVLEQGELFHFGYPPLMKSMYQNNGRELISLFERVKKSGMITSLDMASIDPASEASEVDWKRILQGVLPYVDIFVPSVEELCYMIDQSKYEQWIERANGGDLIDHLTVDDIRPLGEQLIQLGAKMVIIKCGHLGMYYRAANSSIIKELPIAEINYEDWTIVERFEASYIPDQLLSATGAGDTSVAAFLMSLLNGKSLNECLQLATAAGAACVSQYDALGGLLPLDELRLKIQNGWKKRI